jgi:hypothetical protein
MFEELKSAFNIQKVCLKKNKMYLFDKKIKSVFKSIKSLKIVKTTFGKSLKMKLLSKSYF